MCLVIFLQDSGSSSCFKSGGTDCPKMRSNCCPALPQIWSFGAGWVASFCLVGFGCFGCGAGYPVPEPEVGVRRLPLHGAFPVLPQSGVSSATTFLVGIWFHFERSLHRLNALKMYYCDLMWFFSNFPLYLRQKLQVPKNKRTKYCTQKYPLLLKSPGLFFM